MKQRSEQVILQDKLADQPVEYISQIVMPGAAIFSGTAAAISSHGSSAVAMLCTRHQAVSGSMTVPRRVCMCTVHRHVRAGAGTSNWAL